MCLHQGGEEKRGSVVNGLWRILKNTINRSVRLSTVLCHSCVSANSSCCAWTYIVRLFGCHAVHPLLSHRWPWRGLEMMPAWHVVIDWSGLWLYAAVTKAHSEQDKGELRGWVVFITLLLFLSLCLLTFVFAVHLIFAFKKTLLCFWSCFRH